MIEKLVKVQNELKAPKNQRNNFGKYNYRSCEDILEAVKPLLYKHGLLLSVSDEIKENPLGIYVEATATVTDGEKSHKVTAQAGIDVNRKGMDISQSYGSSSSYARKYALNGLFLIDDTKDADATNNHGKNNLIAGTPAFNKVKVALDSGNFTIKQVESKYNLTQEVKSLLTLKK